ncbi:hypothetical protein [Rossellomorea yichunensis]|uniref:hypothetical protein n=1 Tax=Rossellomorea yichunensis TaxID=3077331 RepID=UPI0028E02558|nr:hypothetical protein [Rossellomorea sp. YC4-1]MDT9027136.1 hypothetical protein [Rossellomorea sp. YC4-1]
MSSSVVSFLLLFASLSGWGLLSFNRVKVHIAFIPIFIFSSITTVVFCAGLINVMPLAVNLIYYSGLILFVIYLILFFRRKQALMPMLHPGIIVFALSILAMMIYLKGLILTHYDNFSHWGLIVREMSLINGLPDSSTIVTFQNYPPGSAVFIYFILEVLGEHESYALMAQAFLAISCVVTLYFFSEWKRPAVILLTMAAGISLLLVNWGSFYNLLVDILLGLVALASVIVAYYYRGDWKKQLIVNTPILILLMLLKDSGKIFLAFNVIIILSFIYFYYVHKKRLTKDVRKIVYNALVWLIGIPMFLNYLWIKYTIKAYQTGYGANKFAVTPDKVANNDKSSEFMDHIGPQLWRASTNLESNNFKAVVIVNMIAVILLVVMYVVQRKLSRLLVFSIFISNGFYVLYMFSLYFMYVYLMPEFEAARIAGFGRYQSTIIIYVIGILMCAVIHEWNRYINNKPISKIITLFLLGSLFVYPFSGNMRVITEKPETISSIRWEVKNKFSKIASTGGIDPEVTYYSPKSKNDRGYLKYIVSYEQLSMNYSITNGLSSEEEKEKFFISLKKSDFLVVLDSDKRFNEWLLKYIDVDNPEGVYKVLYENDEWTITPI